MQRSLASHRRKLHCNSAGPVSGCAWRARVLPSHQPTRPTMAFDAIKAEIRALLEQSIEEPQDAHELHLQLIARLNELRATGMPLPEDLVELEKRLTASFDQLPE